MSLFIKNNGENYDVPAVRHRVGVFSGIQGMICNILLAFTKILFGIVSGSMAILSDGVNNLGDLVSSLITYIGFKASGKEADRKHPYGYGRSEYIAGLLVSMMITVVGIELMKSGIDKIISPTDMDISNVTVIALIASICIKMYLGIFNKVFAKKIKSKSLASTSLDSFSDCIVTGVVLFSTILYGTTAVNIDGIASVCVAIFVITIGVKAIKDTIDPILGEEADSEYVKRVEALIKKDDRIVGVHDLIIHNYGLGKIYINADVEIDCNLSLTDSHRIINAAERRISKVMGCEISLHADPVDITNERFMELKKKTTRIIADINNEMINKENKEKDKKTRFNKLKKNNRKLKMHDFRKEEKGGKEFISFEIVVPPEHKSSSQEIKNEVKKRLQENEKEINIDITIDNVFSHDVC